jgi:hypothetical protein
MQSSRPFTAKELWKATYSAVRKYRPQRHPRNDSDPPLWNACRAAYLNRWRDGNKHYYGKHLNCYAGGGSNRAWLSSWNLNRYPKAKGVPGHFCVSITICEAKQLEFNCAHGTYRITPLSQGQWHPTKPHVLRHLVPDPN